MRLAGVFTASITPLREGKLDSAALLSFLQWQAENGVHGFVPCGTTGEGSTLTREERQQVIKTTCDFAQSKNLTVIAGAGHNSTAVTLELIKEAKELGANAALVVTPYYNKPTQAGLIAHYEMLADKGGLPIVLYNVPGRTSVSLTVETMAHLLRHPNIVGVKEASGQYSVLNSLAREVDLSTKSLLAGDDDAFALARVLGGSGIISATANCAPKLFVKLNQLCDDKKWEEAFQLQVKLLPLIKSMFVETNPSPAKYAVSKLLKATDEVRLPLVGVSASTKQLIEKALAELELAE